MTSTALQPVRAMHLLPHQGVGGLQRFVIEFVRHERMDQAWDELVLTRRPLDVDKDFLAPATPVHFLSLVDAPLKARAKRLADLAESRSTRILHAYAADDLNLALEAKAQKGSSLKVVATLFEPPKASGFLETRRLRRALAAVDDFFVASPALRAPWEVLGAAPTERLAAVDTQRFHPAEVQSSWRNARLPDPDTLLVGSLMRADSTKSPEVLIEAAARRHGAGRPTALMLVGDGPRYPELKAQAKDSRTLFVRRRVLDGPGFFSRIDAFALHCPTELVPVSLIESLSCGRAATVADPGGVADLVGRDAALMTPPGDVDAVIEAFDRLADQDFAKDLGARGRQRALERHSLGAHRSALRAAYA